MSNIVWETPKSCNGAWIGDLTFYALLQYEIIDPETFESMLSNTIVDDKQNYKRN